MGLQGWILLLTGIVVGIPALWIVSRKVRGPPNVEPTFWCALPAAATADFHVVFALRRPIEELPPGDADDFAATSLISRDSKVGLVLDPGTYWLYAVAARGRVGVIEALDIAFSAARSRSGLLSFDDQPVVVPPRRAQ